MENGINEDRKARRAGWILSIFLWVAGLSASFIGIRYGLIKKFFTVYSGSTSLRGIGEKIGTATGGMAIMQGVGITLIGFLLIAAGIAIWYSVCRPTSEKKHD